MSAKVALKYSVQSATQDPEREDHLCSEQVTHKKIEEYWLFLD